MRRSWIIVYLTFTISLLKLFIWLENKDNRQDYLKIVHKQLKVNFPDLEKVSLVNVKNMKTILYATSVYGMDHWGIGFGTEPLELQGCKLQNCILTSDKNYYGVNNTDKFDAIIFPLIKMMSKEAISKIKIPKRSHKQRYIAMFEDSPRIKDLIHPSISRNFFNWTMTYRRDSDIPNPYGRIVNLWNPGRIITEQIGTKIHDMIDPMERENFQTKRKKLIAWVVSNCENETSGRMKYVREMQKYVQIDIFGKCGDHICANKSGTFPCDYKIANDYKFYLAFENSICVDYVTEKLFNTLMLPIVPVVLGGADYSRHAPEHSYINVFDYQSPKDLVQYLKYLDANDEEYLKYFTWKKDYSLVRRFPICALCHMLNSDLPKKSYANLHKWWFGYKNEYCLENKS